jgi:hypothetical protein
MRTDAARNRVHAAACIAAVVCATIVGLAGCATARGATGDAAGDAAPPATIAGTPDGIAPPRALTIHAIEPTVRTVSARDLVRAAGSVARYEILEGDPVGGEIVERMTHGSEADGATVLIRSEERDGRASERMTLRAGDDGRIRLERVDSLLDRSRSEFAAPLLFAAEMSGDRALSATSPMTVLTLPALRKRAEGTTRRSLRIAGECDLDLFGDRVRAVALDLEFDVELDVAVATVRSRLFVVPGRGVVAEVRSESRRVLGLFRTTTTETAALRSVDEGAAPAGATAP